MGSLDKDHLLKLALRIQSAGDDELYKARKLSDRVCIMLNCFEKVTDFNEKIKNKTWYDNRKHLPRLELNLQALPGIGNAIEKSKNKRTCLIKNPERIEDALLQCDEYLKKVVELHRQQDKLRECHTLIPLKVVGKSPMHQSYIDRLIAKKEELLKLKERMSKAKKIRKKLLKEQSESINNNNDTFRDTIWDKNKTQYRMDVEANPNASYEQLAKSCVVMTSRTGYCSMTNGFNNAAYDGTIQQREMINADQRHQKRQKENGDENQVPYSAQHWHTWFSTLRRSATNYVFKSEAYALNVDEEYKVTIESGDTIGLVIGDFDRLSRGVINRTSIRATIWKIEPEGVVTKQPELHLDDFLIKINDVDVRKLDYKTISRKIRALVKSKRSFTLTFKHDENRMYPKRYQVSLLQRT